MFLIDISYSKAALKRHSFLAFKWQILWHVIMVSAAGKLSKLRDQVKRVVVMQVIASVSRLAAQLVWKFTIDEPIHSLCFFLVLIYYSLMLCVVSVSPKIKDYLICTFECKMSPSDL